MKIENSNIAQKLALIQLADSFFPAGSFTLSHGLEALVQKGQIQTGSELKTFLQLLLKNKIATCDLVALLSAYQASRENNLPEIRLIDQQLFAQTLIETTREVQRKTGRALLMVASETWPDEKLQTVKEDVAQKRIYCLHPIIFAVVSQVAKIGEEDAVLAFLHGFVTGSLGAAIRLGILGHIQAQQLLLQLAPNMEEAYQIASQLTLEEMSSSTPTIDIAQMQHQKLQRRLFAS
ncbi:urease accessory protein UreF [Xenococcus sp. PCC 7305]|uniref:urease accessory protein UreF n=1 Tax=Xenococcus sp. PCC 7305 TaxID=102125 RepID=UPI0002ACF466|nr:urease accessory UreF family protein [Xenococcus sp. PCC 7305]ELS03013.1 urease accessory protein UreF [Xenococcus sp. PCC 7305]